MGIASMITGIILAASLVLPIFYWTELAAKFDSFPFMLVVAWFTAVPVLIVIALAGLILGIVDTAAKHGRNKKNPPEWYMESLACGIMGIFLNLLFALFLIGLTQRSGVIPEGQYHKDTEIITREIPNDEESQKTIKKMRETLKNLQQEN